MPISYWAKYAWLVVGAATLVIEAWLLGDWIVDDAGITFAYARNAAEGHGWVTFPGEVPVEGFTNLAWASLIRLLLALGVFDVVVAPKVLGALCAIIALGLVQSAVRQSYRVTGMVVFLPLLLLASHPTFAVWSLSGLENGLTAVLVAGMLAVLTRPNALSSLRMALVCGLLAGAAAANRPDGVVLAAWYPLTAILSAERPSSQHVRRSVAALATTFTCVALFTVWRLVTFGEPVPNTFFAKVGDPLGRILPAAASAALLLLSLWVRLRVWPRSLVAGCLHAAVVCAGIMLTTGSGAVRSLGGELGLPLLACAMVLIGPADKGRNAAWAAGSILCLFLYESLPPDWMGLHRFGTPFLVVSLPWLVMQLLSRSQSASRNRRTLWRALACAACLLIGWRSMEKTSDFLEHPTVPMHGIERRHQVFASWAAECSRAPATVGVADVGGALWSRTLQVVDLAGLCDAKIARLIHDPPSLAHYILYQRRPTFLEFHGDWTDRVGLLQHPDFLQIYEPVVQWHRPFTGNDDDAPTVSGGVYVIREQAPEVAILESWRRQWR